MTSYLEPRQSLMNKASAFIDNDKYINKYHPDYIPGTSNIFLQETDADSANETNLKTSKTGIILHPQPTDSPNDPLNWGVWTKASQLAILIFITAFTAATSNDAGADMDKLNEIYDISYAAMNTGAGILFLSIALSTYLLGPSASLYGRKMTYLLCILVGLLGAVWFGKSNKTSDEVWSQLFVGASEGCAEACVQLSISDMFYAHQLSWVLTLYMIATSGGTYLGPLIAGFIEEYQTFRWVGWWGAILSGVLLVVLIFTQYETYFDRSRYVPKEITSEELRVISRPTEKDQELVTVEVSSNMSKGAEPSQSTSTLDSFYIQNNGADENRIPFFRRIQPITLATNLKGFGIKQYIQRLFLMLRVFWFPPVVLSGILWGLQDAFLTFYLTTEDNQYYDPPFNLSATGVALMNVPCLIGSIIGCFYAGVLSDSFVAWMARRRNGIQEAEDYLYFLIAVFFACPIGLMVFAVGTDRLWNWRVTYCVGLSFIGFSFGCSGDIAMSYLMLAYPEMVLEGMIGVSLINNFIGSIFTFVCSYWLDAMGNTNTYAILSAVQVLACVFAIPFLIWGKRMRLWTRKYYLNYVETRDGFQKPQSEI
jgi:MFS family permease